MIPRSRTEILIDGESIGEQLHKPLTCERSTTSVPLTNANATSQSSMPNSTLDILLAITRSAKAIVEITVKMVMAATTSGPRFLLSPGTSLAQML